MTELQTLHDNFYKAVMHGKVMVFGKIWPPEIRERLEKEENDA